MNFKKIQVIAPILIIPILNIIFILFYNESILYKMSTITSVLSLTAASSIYTIRSFNLDRLNKYILYQKITVPVCISCYILCVFYERFGNILIPIWFLLIVSILSTIIMCRLIILNDEEIENMKKEHDEVNKLIESSNLPSKKVNNTEYNVKGKEEKNGKNKN